ncbi:YybH family protein [Dyella nitratireducens]|uniref:SnoaL-like domain-containing protein n=1 Tax=Dyella nitratireducens TaxID=1849580 RepID=A0ABQ1FL08_9GAMM|nr:nuclear transport factor 2 family protein [Dyella nitratireducens]GGA19567.1 hypothetical protein GCM10010981_04470 [Dyella nitratireducens]GLQ44491.1 hypothetical protein GCM10007902_43410 [Dyella nitratireducens]
MKKMILIAAIFLTFGCSIAAAAPSDDAATTATQAVADIQHVMDTYHHAVASHDGQGVSALFLHNGTLVNVLSDKAFAAEKAKANPKPKVRISSYQDFAKFVSSTKSSLDPRHIDVQIKSDGTVASVYFHFDFVMDGKVENHGDETWQLVKTVDGWRIVIITYSSNPGAA